MNQNFDLESSLTDVQKKPRAFDDRAIDDRTDSRYVNAYSVTFFIIWGRKLSLNGYTRPRNIFLSVSAP